MNRGERGKRGIRAAAVVAGLGLVIPAAAWGFADDLGPRPIAMGQSGLADARGTDGLRLNPGGMSLAPLYTLSGDYQFVTKQGGHALRVAIADSTSASGLAGGLYYGYRAASPAGAPTLGAHEAGLALAYPFADRFFLGATLKYFRVSGLLEADGNARHTGFTTDVGIVVKGGSGISVGVTGYNLRDLGSREAPVALGYGVAVAPQPTLTFTLDVRHDFTTYDPTRGVATSVGGGGELVAQGFLVIRAGGGRDGTTRAGYATAGVAALSGLGAIDAGVRQDLTGDRKLTYVVVGLQLFVESPKPSGSSDIH